MQGEDSGKSLCVLGTAQTNVTTVSRASPGGFEEGCVQIAFRVRQLHQHILLSINQMLGTMQGVRVMENKYHSSTRDAAPARPLRYCHFPKNWRDGRGNHISQALDTELQDLVFDLLALSFALMQFLLSLLLSALEDVCLHF